MIAAFVGVKRREPPILKGANNPQDGGSPVWTMIPSLAQTVEALVPAFTQPSFATHSSLLLAWVMNLGRRNLRRVAENTRPEVLPDHARRHDSDTYYNFFERSAWTPGNLAYRLCVLVFTTLKLVGPITLLIDDTLAHKRGASVWGLGWWRDAVASTKKRVATASGHNWVVVAVAVRLPFTNVPILAFPLLSRLHLPGKDQPSCADLAREMVAEVGAWFPDRTFVLVGDGAYACKELLRDLPGPVTFVGRMRADAALYDPRVPAQPTGKRGPKPKKGPRLPNPKGAAAKATGRQGDWAWQSVSVTIYGQVRDLLVVSYEALWPRVLGRPVRVVVVRDPSGRMDDAHLFTTDRGASVAWVIGKFAERWSIEVLFRSSKQVMEVEGPQHWCRQSVEKVAPWVWAVQSVVMVWYVSAGHEAAEASELRARMGAWDSEWSLRHMLQVLRRAVLNATINPDSADEPELRIMVNTLKNWAHLAA